MSELSVVEQRREVLALAAEIRAMPQISVPVAHYFADGLYAREITLPKGALAEGKIHKGESLTILLQGQISIYNLGTVTRYAAPFTFVTPPGSKRIAYAHEDATIMNVHATRQTDLDALEDEIIAKDFDDPALTQTGAIPWFG